MPLDPPTGVIPIIQPAPIVEEKLLSKLLRESWFPILMWTIAFAFSLGMAYANVTSQVNTNQVRLNGVETTEGTTRSELLNQIQMNKQDMTDRLNSMDKKLDDINKYLRDKK